MAPRTSLQSKRDKQRISKQDAQRSNSRKKSRSQRSSIGVTPSSLPTPPPPHTTGQDTIVSMEDMADNISSQPSAQPQNCDNNNNNNNNNNVDNSRSDNTIEPEQHPQDCTCFLRRQPGLFLPPSLLDSYTDGDDYTGGYHGGQERNSRA